MSNTGRNNIMTDRVSYYFKSQWNILLIITISGLIYNLGLLAGPWFEGRMTGCLVNILGGKSTFTDMLILVICDCNCSSADIKVYQEILCKKIR